MMRSTGILWASTALAACTPAAHPGGEGVSVRHGRPATVAPVLERLVGDRVHAEADGRTFFHEQWRSAGPDSLTGLGFVMSGPDTVFIEHLGLAWSEDRATYWARIPSQNHGRGVPFRMTHGGADSLVFENAAHDFPQRIVYVPGDAAWQVTVSGTEDGRAVDHRYSFVPRSKATP
jgi:hypothetical protein